MKKVALAVVLVAVVLFTPGCLMSWNPFYTAQTSVFEPGLVGTWGDATESVTWKFERPDPSAPVYRLTDTRPAEKVDFFRPGSPTGQPPKVSATFEAHLFRLGDTVFLDLYPDETSGQVNALFAFHLAGTHTVWKIVLRPTQIEVAAPDDSYVQRLLDDKGLNLSHVRRQHPAPLGDDVLVTAETAALQKALASIATVREAFETPEVMQRQK
jgi:hypothetical protein